MRHKLLFLPFLIAIVGLSMMGKRPLVQSAKSEPVASAPQVVELFTSQSCSSCPPADELLGRLNTQDNIIALSCHVTYWDHLNWRDTLSRQFCTDRQRAYARFQDKRQVYTPQMVVNGRYEMVGSNSRDVMSALNQPDAPVQPITLHKTGPQTLQATLPKLDGETGMQTLWLLSFRPTHTEAIPSGENRGRTVTYTNSVTALEQVGTWDGEAKTLTLTTPNASDGEDTGYAIIAQPRGFGAVRAAGKL